MRLSRGRVMLTAALMMRLQGTRTTVDVAWEVAAEAEDEAAMMAGHLLVVEEVRAEAATRIKTTNNSRSKEAIRSSRRDRAFGQRTRSPRRAMTAQVISRSRATQLNRRRRMAKAKKESRKRIRRKILNMMRMRTERHSNSSSSSNAWALHTPQHRSPRHSTSTRIPRQVHWGTIWMDSWVLLSSAVSNSVNSFYPWMNKDKNTPKVALMC